MTKSSVRRAPRRRAGAPEGNTRERILAAALEVFAEHGFEGAKTRDIAARAGANLGLITYYFASKEKLWRASFEAAFAELTGALGDLAAAPPSPTATGDERAQLERFLRGFVRFMARNPAFMRLMNDEGKRDGPRMRWLADRFVRPLSERLHLLVEAAQARSQLPALPVVSLHYIALGAGGLVFSQAPECRYLTGVDPTSEAFAAAHADALVRLLLGPE